MLRLTRRKARRSERPKLWRRSVLRVTKRRKRKAKLKLLEEE